MTRLALVTVPLVPGRNLSALLLPAVLLAALTPAANADSDLKRAAKTAEREIYSWTMTAKIDIGEGMLYQVCLLDDCRGRAATFEVVP